MHACMPSLRDLRSIFNSVYRQHVTRFFQVDMPCGLGCSCSDHWTSLQICGCPQSPERVKRSSSSVRTGRVRITTRHRQRTPPPASRRHGHTSRNALKQSTTVLLRMHGVPQVHFAGRSEPLPPERGREIDHTSTRGSWWCWST